VTAGATSVGVGVGATALLAGVMVVAGAGAMIVGVATVAVGATVWVAGVATLVDGTTKSSAACAGKLTTAQGIRHKVEIIRFLRGLLRILCLSNKKSLGKKNNFVVLEIITSTADILSCIQHTPMDKNNQFSRWLRSNNHLINLILIDSFTGNFSIF
jgi:hypothetical protein